jgi:hypothetical protein
MTRPGRTLFVKAGLALALAVYAVLTVGNGFDRLSADAPQFERLVPRPLRAEADRAAARTAAARGQPQALFAAAKSAVKADPVDPASTSLLGGALLLRGDNPGAERAFRVAARFGWRDVPTQAYWYEAALEARQMEPAADRLDALLRANPNLSSSDALLAQLEATPAGRAALERRLAERPGWLQSYLQVAGKPPELLDRRVVVLTELARRGMRVGCRDIAATVASALASGGRRQAEQLWQAHCPGAKVTGGLADPGFERLGDEQAFPFGWRTAPSGDVAIDPVRDRSGGRTLRLSNSASVARLVLLQSVALEPGRYRLTARATPGRLAASLGCNADPPRPSLSSGDLAASGQVLEVPACARLTLGLWLRPGGEAAELGPLMLQLDR